MIPGEILVSEGDLELNAGLATINIVVANSGDRPIQVGSHYHFYETNPALKFERDKTRGYRPDIPAGTAIQFEPGQQREIQLVPYRGTRHIYGFRQQIMGDLNGTEK